MEIEKKISTKCCGEGDIAP
jgi:hypothetical protein